MVHHRCQYTSSVCSSEASVNDLDFSALIDEVIAAFIEDKESFEVVYARILQKAKSVDITHAVFARALLKLDDARQAPA